MTDKCENCLNSRLVVSENGFHYLCGLRFSEAFDCLKGKYNYFVNTIPAWKITGSEVETIC